jgi:hypothetical protein
VVVEVIQDHVPARDAHRHRLQPTG